MDGTKHSSVDRERNFGLASATYSYQDANSNAIGVIDQEKNQSIDDGSSEEHKNLRYVDNIQREHRKLSNLANQARAVDTDKEIENLKREIEKERLEKKNLKSQIEDLQTSFTNQTEKHAKDDESSKQKSLKIKHLEESILQKDRMILEKQLSGTNLQEMVEQAAKVHKDKLEHMEKKVKKQKSKNLKIQKESSELAMKLSVTSDELRICRSQINDLQAIRKQGTDGLMSEYSENLSLRERMLGK
jgi:hypothetical protein